MVSCADDEAAIRAAEGLLEKMHLSYGTWTAGSPSSSRPRNGSNGTPFADEDELKTYIFGAVLRFRRAPGGLAGVESFESGKKIADQEWQ